MPRRKKQPDPDVIRLTNLSAHGVPGFTITNISEQDLRMLHDGGVPAWIHDTVAFWLRDHPKPSDVPVFEHQRDSEVA